MIRHSRSFIVSILIHIMLFGVLYLTYKEVSAGFKAEKKEPLLCIKLSSCQIQNTPKKNTKVPVKANKKIVKAEVKKLIPVKKIVTKKKIVAKKKLEVKKNLETIKKVEVQKKIENKIQNSTVTPKVSKPLTKPVKKRVSPEKEYIDENIAKIIALLKENLYYPRRARKRGIEGEVLVRFTLSVEAKISDVEILSSSSEVLSRGALQTIKNIDYKLPKPKQKITFNVPISYKLY
ncbi:MAG: TonB family protein [Sulfurimonas sp.]|nr:TonB family protein [Sulfurimonas sp.]